MSLYLMFMLLSAGQVINRLLTLQPSFFSRPFVSLTQAAEIAEKGKNKVKNKGNLLPQRHLTTEGAEEGIFFSLQTETII